MSKDNEFYKALRRIFQEIFENKNLVQQQRFGRTDFREIEYSLPPFGARSVARGPGISFLPNNTGTHLSEIWEKLHRHEYIIFLEGQPIAKVQRLPKRRVVFFTKPYSSTERFIDNSLRNTIAMFDSVSVVFEPGEQP